MFIRAVQCWLLSRILSILVASDWCIWEHLAWWWVLFPGIAGIYSPYMDIHAYIWTWLINQLKDKNYAGTCTVGKIIPIETHQASSSPCDRVSHSSWWLEPPTGNWKVIGPISEQFVMYTAVLNICFRFVAWFYFSNIVCIIFPFVYCYYLFYVFPHKILNYFHWSALELLVT